MLLFTDVSFFLRKEIIIHLLICYIYNERNKVPDRIAFFLSLFFPGAKACKWLRWPCVVYGTHVATTLIPIIAHVLLHDFSSGKVPGPRNLQERLTLLSFYSPYFVIPVILVVDSLFSNAYKDKYEKKALAKKSK